MIHCTCVTNILVYFDSAVTAHKRSNLIYMYMCTLLYNTIKYFLYRANQVGSTIFVIFFLHRVSAVLLDPESVKVY